MGVGLFFILGGLLVSRLVRPHRPNEEKNTAYECGEPSLPTPSSTFNFRFYAAALVFLVFEAEAIFLFPWSVAFSTNYIDQAIAEDWVISVFLEGVIFIVLLFIGLIYAWKKGLLDWDKPDFEKVTLSTPLEEEEYLSINKQLTGKGS